jgi:hypothetical protein
MILQDMWLNCVACLTKSKLLNMVFCQVALSIKIACDHKNIKELYAHLSKQE